MTKHKTNTLIIQEIKELIKEFRKENKQLREEKLAYKKLYKHLGLRFDKQKVDFIKKKSELNEIIKHQAKIIYEMGRSIKIKDFRFKEQGKEAGK